MIEEVTRLIIEAKKRCDIVVGIRMGRGAYEEMNEECQQRMGDDTTTFQLLNFQGLPITVVDDPALSEEARVVSFKKGLWHSKGGGG